MSDDRKITHVRVGITSLDNGKFTVQDLIDLLGDRFTVKVTYQRRTHCPWGHEYTAENTYEQGGSRVCKYCNAVRTFASKRCMTLSEYYAKYPKMLTEYFSQ